jgi:hypothetical protein
MTTSRASAKARAWRRDPFVAGMVRTDTAAVMFRGRVRTHDALDPNSWPAISGGPAVARASARFALRNARFFAGYAVDARRVPLVWGPAGRRFVRLSLHDGMVVTSETGDASPRGARGRRDPRLPAVLRASSPAPAADLGAPADVRRARGNRQRSQPSGKDGPLVLPVRWRRRCRRPPRPPPGSARPRERPRGVGLGVRGVACRTMARHAPRGAGVRAGATRGDAAALGGAFPGSLVRVRPSRVVWWRGWTSGTVAA